MILDDNNIPRYELYHVFKLRSKQRIWRIITPLTLPNAVLFTFILPICNHNYLGMDKQWKEDGVNITKNPLL